ncbi:MAG: hypothetical protein HYV33_05455 [Candidatus Kerfeldbacteria bacterium]|nr:hypothetical protein [Candidatus Kerfeldbacteria bacterium]
MKFTKPSYLIRGIIWFGTAVLLLLISIIFIIRPGQSAIGTTTAAVRTVIAEQTTPQSATSNLVRAVKREQDIDAMTIQLLNNYIDPAAPLDFINLLEQAATSRSVDVSFTITDPIPSHIQAGEPAPVRLTLAITGELVAVLEFINDVVTQPMQLDIAAITIQPAEHGAIQANVTVTSHWQ